MNDDIVQFLKRCKIEIDSLDQLDGQLIPRDLFLSTERYKMVQPDVAKLKKKFSSSSLTSLQSSAQRDQRWPLLNLVRQILRVCNYQMVPRRLSNGYDKKTRQKRYKRYFLIRRLSPTAAADP
jgi:hypothetical protein